MIKIYTDGSATKKRSGWGYVIVFPDKTIDTHSGAVPNATNQQMELTAVLKALNQWKEQLSQKYDVTIYTDSAYVSNCYEQQWYKTWNNNGWRNSKGEDVANQELWIQLIPFFETPGVFIQKVKGHSGNVYNNIADKLACGLYDEQQNLTDKKINDTINIELSKILTEYKMNKLTINKTIDRIIEVFNG